MVLSEHNRQFGDYFDKQTNKFARNIFYTNIIFIYLKASTDVKIKTFCEKNGG